MGDVWFISDSHFCHSNIIGYCLRPHYDVDHMNQDIISRWNQSIKTGDKVYHLGDFGRGGQTELGPIIQKLNGNIHLIRGNHDGRNDNLYNDKFEKVSYDYWIDIEVDREERKVYLVHRPQDRNYDYFTICGHTHDHWRWLPNRLNVSVEQWDYRPVSLDEVKHYIRNNDYHREQAEQKGYVFDHGRKLEELGLLDNQ